VGSVFAVEGRIQSRHYTKQLPEGTFQRTAYEVSVMHPLDPEELMFDFL